jgi:pSer/pThr/pTyr-binding forkhead associated (FHA) protein
MAKLHLLPETTDTEPFELIETVALIGRKPDNTLQVEDTNVSKYHALLVKSDEGYRLYDLHSANGTYVNDTRITTTILRNNDQLRIGPAIFRFESEPIPVATPKLETRPKIRLASRVAGGHLGQKPDPTHAPVAKSATDHTYISPPPPAAPAPTPSLVPEPKTPPPPSVLPTTVTPTPATPVAETLPAAKEEPRVSIRIPESKKTLLSQPLTASDAKETQPTTPTTKPPEPEKPKLRLGFGPKPAPAPAPTPASAEPLPPAATPPEPERPKPRFAFAPKPSTQSTPAPTPAPEPALPKPDLGFAPKPPAEPEPPPAPEPVPEKPVQPQAPTLGGPKPPSAERSLRPKLGGAGGGELKLKTFKK